MSRFDEIVERYGAMPFSREVNGGDMGAVFAFAKHGPDDLYWLMGGVAQLAIFGALALQQRLLRVEYDNDEQHASNVPEDKQANWSQDLATHIKDKTGMTWQELLVLARKEGHIPKRPCDERN